jgi:thiol:disulfide interchange protein
MVSKRSVIDPTSRVVQVKTVEDFDKYLKMAEKRDVAAFVYFTASWCVMSIAIMLTR